MSDEYIESQLKKDCLNIVVPNLFGYGKAFYPQFLWNKRNRPLNNDSNEMFPHTNAFMEKCIQNSTTIDEIVSLIMEGNLFTEEEIRDIFNKYMESLLERQKNGDISIYDFIKNNYKDQQLFYDQGHPTNIIMTEIAKQVLEKLDIFAEPYCETVMDEHEEFVYPCVSKVLSLNWKQEEIRKSKNDRRVAEKMDINEYVNEYIWWSYTENR